MFQLGTNSVQEISSDSYRDIPPLPPSQPTSSLCNISHISLATHPGTSTMSPTYSSSDFTLASYYALKAVVIHIGEANEGHYISCVHNGSKTNKINYWTLFDDESRTSSLAFEDVLELAGGKAGVGGQAYILFYEKIL